jgi:hypothetical protein
MQGTPGFIDWLDLTQPRALIALWRDQYAAPRERIDSSMLMQSWVEWLGFSHGEGLRGYA